MNLSRLRLATVNMRTPGTSGVDETSQNSVAHEPYILSRYLGPLSAVGDRA